MNYLLLNEYGLIGVIIAAGILGGTINYYFSNDKKEDASEPPQNEPSAAKLRSINVNSWAKCVVIGIGASFLVPLFLATISSTLLKSVLDTTRSAETSANIFIFFGFCLIAAITSRAFIQTISDKVLKEMVEKAKQKADATSNDLKQVDAALKVLEVRKTEPEESESRSEDGALKSKTVASNLTSDEIKVLESVFHPNYVLRTKTGISKDSGLDLVQLATPLNDLKEKSLISKLDRSKGERWALTANGMKALSEIKNNFPNT